METGANVPLYGPYSKKYLGLSKIVPRAQAPGARFDLVVHPTCVNGAVPVPNTTFPCGYHPWQAAPDGSFYSYRCELLPKDRLYASIAFFRLDENAWGVRTRFHNRTELPRNCMLNYFCALEYPAARRTLPVLPEGAVRWHALDYASYTYAQPRPWDGLAPDALQKGEFRDEAFTDGHGLGDRVPHAHMPRLAGLRPFGAQAGDAVGYRVAVPGFEDAALTVRYRTVPPQGGHGERGASAEPVVFDTAFGPLSFPPSDAPAFVSFPLGAVPPGELALTLTARGTGGAGVELDFFAVTARARAAAVGVCTQEPDARPVLERERDGQYRLRYAGVDEAFCVRVYGERRRERLLETGSLEDALISRLSNPDHTFDDVLNPFSGSFRRKHSDPGWYQNLLVSGLFLQPGACHTEYAVLSATPRTDTPQALEQVFRAGKRRAKLPAFNPAGRRYRLSVRCLRAAALQGKLKRNLCRVLLFRERTVGLGKTDRNGQRHAEIGAAGSIDAVENLKLARDDFIHIPFLKQQDIFVALIFLENAAAFLRPLGQDRRYLRRALAESVLLVLPYLLEVIYNYMCDRKFIFGN